MHWNIRMQRLHKIIGFIVRVESTELPLPGKYTIVDAEQMEHWYSFVGGENINKIERKIIYLFVVSHMVSCGITQTLSFSLSKCRKMYTDFDPNPMMITYLFQLVASHEFQWIVSSANFCHVMFGFYIISWQNHFAVVHMCWLQQKKSAPRKGNRRIKSISARNRASGVRHWLLNGKGMKWANQTTSKPLNRTEHKRTTSKRKTITMHM